MVYSLLKINTIATKSRIAGTMNQPLLKKVRKMKYQKQPARTITSRICRIVHPLNRFSFFIVSN